MPNTLKRVDTGKFKFSERDLKPLFPKNGNQLKAVESFLYEDKNLVLMGSAGTGKTFLSTYLGLKMVLNKESSYEKLMVVRSAVPTRDIGFLPGDEKEKTEVYEAPYAETFDRLFEFKKSWERLKVLGLVEFKTTSYLRGLDRNNTIIIVDECQSLNAHELDTIITRVGTNSKIIFSGDFIQTDLTKVKERSGIQEFLNILDCMPEFVRVDFTEQDIVRSGLVRNYIIKRNKLGLSC